MVKDSNNSSDVTDEFFDVFDHFVGLALKGLRTSENYQYLFSSCITLDFDKGSTVSSSRALDRKSSKAGIKNEDIDQFLMVTRI